MIEALTRAFKVNCIYLLPRHFSIFMLYSVAKELFTSGTYVYLAKNDRH